ncbi:MAG: nucleoside-diphosphate sugar epimerase [Acidobacteria bacterium]|nr:nucleoside-diphosphate sugar epimerase [Acidobacteriota bacterium]
MRIAITGGTGFIGGHLAQRLAAEGHEVVLLGRGKRAAKDAEVGTRARFVCADLSSVDSLTNAFAGCDVVAHCAGINRELGQQTYQRVHVEATRNVVAAAREAGVKKILLMSFLRARANCGSPYHESKWTAEEIVRHSGLDYTIIRAGMVYGRGDHMLDHLSHALYTFPLFAMVGMKEKGIRPLAIEDLIVIMRAAIVAGRMTQKTVAVTGAEELLLSEAVRRVARVTGKRIRMVRAPIWFHYLLARVCEWTMTVPLVARAQVRILSEGVTESALPCDALPYDLMPTRKFTDEQIRNGLPEPGAFGLEDLRWCATR